MTSRPTCDLTNRRTTTHHPAIPHGTHPADSPIGACPAPRTHGLRCVVPPPVAAPPGHAVDGLCSRIRGKSSPSSNHDRRRPGGHQSTGHVSWNGESINDVLVEVDLVRRGVRESHRRLHRAASLLDEQRMREPSQLPGWTRDHLRTHLARNTDSVVRRLQAASQGEASTSTPSRAGRAREIERGADRPFGKIVADLHAADDALDTLDLPSDTWSGKVHAAAGTPRSCSPPPSSCGLDGARSRSTTATSAWATPFRTDHTFWCPGCCHDYSPPFRRGSTNTS